jgi:hypothetical protein
VARNAMGKCHSDGELARRARTELALPDRNVLADKCRALLRERTRITDEAAAIAAGLSARATEGRLALAEAGGGRASEAVGSAALADLRTWIANSRPNT